MTDEQLLGWLRSGLEAIVNDRWKWVRRHIDQVATLRHDPIASFE